MAPESSAAAPLTHKSTTARTRYVLRPASVHGQATILHAHQVLVGSFTWIPALSRYATAPHSSPPSDTRAAADRRGKLGGSPLGQGRVRVPVRQPGVGVIARDAPSAWLLRRAYAATRPGAPTPRPSAHHRRSQRPAHGRQRTANLCEITTSWSALSVHNHTTSDTKPNTKMDPKIHHQAHHPPTTPPHTPIIARAFARPTVDWWLAAGRVRLIGAGGCGVHRRAGPRCDRLRSPGRRDVRAATVAWSHTRRTRGTCGWSRSCRAPKVCHLSWPGRSCQTLTSHEDQNDTLKSDRQRREDVQQESPRPVKARFPLVVTSSGTPHPPAGAESSPRKPG
jgi:hypothetical protein